VLLLLLPLLPLLPPPPLVPRGSSRQKHSLLPHERQKSAHG
jgi:hypothetical protein